MGCDLVKARRVTVVLYKVSKKIEYLLLSLCQRLHTSPQKSWPKLDRECRQESKKKRSFEYPPACEIHVAALGYKNGHKKPAFSTGPLRLIAIVHEHKAKVKRKIGEDDGAVYRKRRCCIRRRNKNRHRAGARSLENRWGSPFCKCRFGAKRIAKSSRRCLRRSKGYGRC